MPFLHNPEEKKKKKKQRRSKTERQKQLDQREIKDPKHETTSNSDMDLK